MKNQPKSTRIMVISIVILVIAVAIIGSTWWLVTTMSEPTPINKNTSQTTSVENIKFFGITPLSLGIGVWETEHGSTVADYGYEWQEEGLFLQFGFSTNICEDIKQITASRDTGKREISSLSITIAETNFQEETGSYCNGIQTYIFEGIIEDIPQGTFTLIIQDSTYGKIEYENNKKITTPLKHYHNTLGTPQDLILPTTNINTNSSNTNIVQQNNTPFKLSSNVTGCAETDTGMGTRTADDPKIESSPGVEVSNSGLVYTYTREHQCCRKAEVTAAINGSSITLTEVWTGEGCRCMCISDISATIENIPAGLYMVTVIQQGDNGVSDSGTKLLEQAITITNANLNTATNNINSQTNQNRNSNTNSNSNQAANCATLGQRGPNYSLGPADPRQTVECCDGLVLKNPLSAYRNDCEAGEGLGTVCIACGDGMCDSTYESTCNCPDDCE